MRPLLLAFALASVACATGDSVAGSAGPGSGSGGDGGATGQGGEGGASSSSRSSGPGAPSSTTTSGPGGPTTTSGSGPGSTSSTGTPCEESPCKLVAPQCGCGAGEMCTVDGAGDRVCADEGTRTPGQECGSAVGDCQAGALCVYVFDAGETLSCARFCETDAQCEGQGGLCALGLTGVEDAKLCSENCDVVSSSGCAIAGTKCGLGFDEAGDWYFSVCSGAGSGVAQAICEDSSQCAPGYECLETTEQVTTFRCFKWCSSLAPGCPEGQSCQMGFDPPVVIGNVTYGICSG